MYDRKLLSARLQQKDRPIKLKIQDCNKIQTDPVKETRLQQHTDR